MNYCLVIGSEGEKVLHYTYLMNFKAALVPQGNLSARSNVFPNIISSAVWGWRKRPIIIEMIAVSVCIVPSHLTNSRSEYAGGVAQKSIC